MLKISNGHPENVGVWIDGCIHAREWISPAVVTYVADQIARKFKSHPPYLTNKDWSVITLFQNRSVITYTTGLSYTKDINNVKMLKNYFNYVGLWN